MVNIFIFKNEISLYKCKKSKKLVYSLLLLSVTLEFINMYVLFMRRFLFFKS